jgi:uncharacterized protein YeeX (DUF496 family)
MQNNSHRRPVFILWILLAASIGLNIFQGLNIHNIQQEYDVKVDSLLTARVDVEKELSDTWSELNKYKGISGRLDSLLQEADGKLSQQKTRIDELVRDEKNNVALNKKLQDELAQLKSLREEYLEKIDSLLVENENLKKEKSTLATTVDSLAKNLKSTVNTAAVIKSEYFTVTAYKKRINNKYAATAIAKRTNKIEACFTLLENAIAKPGARNIYLRIVEPGGKVLGNRSSGSNTFRKSDSSEEVLFTAVLEVNYDNKKQNVCLNWEETDRVFLPGTYLVEIYADGALSGMSSIDLR